MTADVVKISFDEVEQKAREIKKQAQGLAGTVSGLDADIAQLLEEWGGDAADAFGASYRVWSTEMSTHVEILEALAGILMVVRNKLFSIEQDVKDHWVGM